MARRRLLLMLTAMLAAPTAVDPGGAVAGVMYLCGLALVVVVLWAGAQRWSGAARQGWRFIAAGASCWLAGDLVQRVFEMMGRPFDRAGPADVFWLASYPLVVLGVAAMIRGRGVPTARWREIRLDVLAITVAGAAGAWKLMMQPEVDAGALSFDTVLVVLYPLGDVAILGVALTLLMTPGRRTAASALVIACCGLTLALDSAYAALPAIAPAFDVARLDALLLLVNSLLAVAVIHPQGGELAEPIERLDGPNRMPRWRVAVLGMALVFVSMVPALPSGGSSALDQAVLLAAAASLSVTILWRVYGVMRDREAAEELLTFQARHDQLTGLANRALLVERLTREMNDRGDGTEIALCYLDLDGFKAINDGWGHAAGDHVLRIVGDRLTGLTRDGDTVARFGGDEFVVMCRDVRADQAEAIGERFRQAVCRPIALADGSTVEVGVSVGVYMTTRPDTAPRSTYDAEDLLRTADTAMYRAKHHGGGVQVA